MRLFTFKGGIHPNDGKILSKDKAIVPVFPKGELVYPLSQHMGESATPIVSVGDTVLVGQKIAEANGFISAPIYSAVSGVIKTIEEKTSITIENDFEYKQTEYPIIKPLDELSKIEILDLIGEAGIVGMGGAGFPTKAKLSPEEPEKIEYIIANCAECEPFITADYRRMLENSEELISGMKVVLRLFDHAKGIFGIEDNKMDCIQKLQELIIDEPCMEVKALKTKYPQGAERQLIYATTKRAIDSAKLPADVGCIVLNVETLIAIHNAVINGKPVIDRVVTVSGDNVKEPGNFKVLLGTNLMEVIEAAGGFIGEDEKVISGGPMMGTALFALDTPITKTSLSILCMKNDKVAEQEPSACINCGRCVDACPSRIIPSRIADYAERNNEDAFVKWEGLECVECGCCSYICPAKRSLKQSIENMKKIIIENRKQRGN